MHTSITAMFIRLSNKYNRIKRTGNGDASKLVAIKENTKIMFSQIDKITFWKIFYTIFIFIGLILAYLGIALYRVTFIKISIIFIIPTLIGLITFLMTKNHYKAIYKLRGNFFPLIQSMISWGFISIYLILVINYSFADNVKTDYNIMIKSKSSLPGYKIISPRQPTIIFDYNDIEKELVLRSSDYDLLGKTKSIKLSIKKGALGFDIIDNYKLLND